MGLKRAEISNHIGTVAKWLSLKGREKGLKKNV